MRSYTIRHGITQYFGALVNQNRKFCSRIARWTHVRVKHQVERLRVFGAVANGGSPEPDQSVPRVDGSLCGGALSWANWLHLAARYDGIVACAGFGYYAFVRPVIKGLPHP